MDSLEGRSHAIVFAGGEVHASPATSTADTYVVAADSGYDHAMAAGVAVDLLIGDLDSISPDGRTHAETSAVSMQQHPAAKDATDLELALDAAVAAGVSTIDLYGGEGGTLAHLLGVASLISSDTYSDVEIRWRTGHGDVFVVRPGTPLRVSPGTRRAVSLIAPTDCTGVTTAGMEWTLDAEPLMRGESRGLSNRSIASEIAVETATGALLVVIEGANT